MHIWKLIPLTSAAVIVGLAGCVHSGDSATDAELKQRARAGEMDAEYRLGRKYAGAAVASTPEAIYWLCRAAKGGHVPAQLELAALYAKDAQAGNNAAADGPRLSNWGSAYFWYTAAASQGDERALVSRDDLAANMDAEEIMDVKRKATRWQQAVCVEP